MQRQLPTPAPPSVTSPSPTPSGQDESVANGADYFARGKSSTGSEAGARRSTRLASKRVDTETDGVRAVGGRRRHGVGDEDEEDEEVDGEGVFSGADNDDDDDNNNNFSSKGRTRHDENAPPTPRRRTTRRPPNSPKDNTTTATNKTSANGSLKPPSTTTRPSRSPSPLGLIPLHTRFRSTIHRHELPRKALHASIGILTLSLYTRGLQTSQIHPTLLTLLVPITTVELLRHRFPSVNRIYVRCLGALMRESEVKDRWNGVVWYLLGAWGVLRFAPKDVGVVSVILLSWCDTAASTVGRRWGRYTPRVGGRGKSLAGSLAAAVVGVGVGWFFWGVVAPYYHANGSQISEGVNAFAFQGQLALPPFLAQGLLGWREAGDEISVEGKPALAILSVVTGVVASAAEAIDLFGWDDNVTIPVLCGVGLWGFLRVFGGAGGGAG